MDLVDINNFKKLDADFYFQRTETVAKKLLGKILVKKSGKNIIAGLIVEVEAYLPDDDFSSHSAIGLTQRNKVMFDEGGKLYVYKIYGVHHCINVVTEKKGIGAAVLIRAVEPICGVDIMMKNRNCDSLSKLCKGPGNLAKAFGFDMKHNGLSLNSEGLYIADFKKIDEKSIRASKRIGISKSADLNLRFFINESKFISGSKSQNS
jgi:DNA-3-methyladenine glycosylase